MKPPKKFIAITTETLNDKLVLIATSDGDSVAHAGGLYLDVALKFIFNQVHKRGDGQSITFVAYAFSRDIEFIFADLPKELKDKLFRPSHIQHQIDEIEHELESLDDILALNSETTDEHKRAEFERRVNELSLEQITEVRYKGYEILLAPGRSITIRKNGRSLSIYDIYGFFKPYSLRKAVKKWTNKDILILDRSEFDKVKLAGETPLDRLRTKAAIETRCIGNIAQLLHTELTKIGINLTRYHGASAITTYWLSRIDAKGSYHSYRNKRQLSPELDKAARQAYYGGRAEQLQIGTPEKYGTPKPVFVYDINSAYAYACTLLPTCLSKPSYRRHWMDSPFSIWHIDYDFRGSGLQFGLLPNRDIGGTTKYKLKGAGYFWQPEVAYVLEHYPECVKVKGGFVWDYKLAGFTQGIRDLYELRLKLQFDGNPLERVIKLALSAIYGKFAQTIGHGRYYNPFYPGFITSLTRTMLLQATKDNQKDVICFQTDAIHSTAQLPVSTSNELGEYKQVCYPKVTYIDVGVYQCYDERGRVVKQKSQGFRNFDFKKAIAEMNDKRVYTALAEFFVGYNFFRQNLFGKANYLSLHGVNKETRPAEYDKFSMRLFDACKVEFNNTHLNSQPLATYNGLESALYCKPGYKGTDAGLDTIESGRI